MKTPPSVTLHVKRKNASHIRRHRCLDKNNGLDAERPVRKIKQGSCCEKITRPHTVIRRQEMAMYFRMFDDELIQDFLKMDCCYKTTDKYLLAMTFVYFKRACFSIAEYTRENFFIALYLANTMEEDEEEIKYNIFPWALGNKWVERLPCFVKERDKLWVRMEYRAAVSRSCCEEVMAIESSHFVWQRQRSSHHSGALRQYTSQDHKLVLRGPSASPVSCFLCHRGSRLHHNPVSSSTSRGSSEQPADKADPCPFTSALSLEFTPPRTVASQKKARKTKSQACDSFCLCPEQPPREDCTCRSTHGLFMEWVNEV
ncbi:speedy protein A [Parambassis ranga]|uniref:Speedy protein A n=1 Tax=Parambassis ranga TaxID=210632 RepID=A0A6P7HT30_9TELE|nr:speedy protein A [Parambassis ranga]